MKKLLIFYFLLSIFIKGYSQTDSIGSGHAMGFDGVQDYVTISGNYHSLNFPFTISAWVFLNPSSGASPIFVTNDNNPIYRGFWFTISPGALQCEFGDGTGGDAPAFRNGKIASIENVTGRWVNVCAVMSSPFGINLYLNGVDIGGSPSGESSLTMASSYPGDIPKIGYFLSNNVAYHFNGMLDEIRLYNRALALNEVRQGMCQKLKGNELGLIGYWNFDETSGNTVFDKSASGFNGQLVGAPTRIYSGASIGNRSVYLYSGSLAGTTFSINDGNDSLTVTNIKGNPAGLQGIQLYEVVDTPSLTGGLDPKQPSKPYFGAYLAGIDSAGSFDDKSMCKVFYRDNNSIANWLKVDKVINKHLHGEFLRAGVKIPVSLGPDKVLCDSASTILSTGLGSSGVSFDWNTGQTSPEIIVNHSGLYTVAVTQTCGLSVDSIQVSFLTKPHTISLGADETFCIFQPITLKSLTDTTGFEFTWQDGSKLSTFKANNFGTYWVTVYNVCGISSDTIKFTKLSISIIQPPNVITPNGDGLNDFFELQGYLVGRARLLVINRWGKEVYQSDGYTNNWDGYGLSAGVYFIRISGDCISEVKSPLTIIR